MGKWIFLNWSITGSEDNVDFSLLVLFSVEDDKGESIDKSSDEFLSRTGTVEGCGNLGGDAGLNLFKI